VTIILAEDGFLSVFFEALNGLKKELFGFLVLDIAVT